MTATVTRLPEREPRRRGGKLTRFIIAELDEIAAEAGVTKAQLIARTVVNMAAGGNLDATKFIADRVEGRVAQTLNINDDPAAGMAEQITSDTPPTEAMRFYRALVSAGPLDDVDDGIEEADNVISLSARRGSGEEA